MPIYSTCCVTCSARGTVFRRIVERDNLPACSCGGTLLRPVEAPTVAGAITPYESPASGKWITSASARRDDLARTNCVPYDPGMKQDAARNQKASMARTDALVEHFVDKTVGEFAACGRL